MAPTKPRYILGFLLLFLIILSVNARKAGFRFIYLRLPVNATNGAGVVGALQELFDMNMIAQTSAWPEDERDRKRAPARC